MNIEPKTCSELKKTVWIEQSISDLCSMWKFRNNVILVAMLLNGYYILSTQLLRLSPIYIYYN